MPDLTCLFPDFPESGVEAVIPLESINATCEGFPLPRIKILIQDKTVRALLDTGATRNIIKPKYLNNIEELSEPQTFAMACGDGVVDSLGTTVVELQILNKKFSTEFQVISDLNENMILGAPFMYNNEVVLDYKRKCIYIGKDERITVFWDQAVNKYHSTNDLPEELMISDSSLKPLFVEFAELFTENPTQATTVSTKHQIRVKDKTPFNLKPYPMSPAKKKIMYSQIEDMLKAGVIEPSTSPYSSPPVIIERPDKKPRFCIDYRRLNEVSLDEASVLPKIFESIKDLGNATIFTVLDLKSGYWQIPLEESSKIYTAFTTHDGAAYQFNVMPFGLKTAPCTFQKLMSRDVLTGYLHHSCKVYLDDIIIYSENMSDHLQHLRLVFERLRLHNLKISPSKCVIATSEITYLGRKITQTTTRPLEEHKLQINNYTAPVNRKQLQSFLGLCNWVREYIPNAAIVTRPLTKLLSNEYKFKWTNEAQEAFLNIKSILSRPLELHRPNFNKTFILQTDASLQGSSAVLYQLGDEGEKYIISYASNTLSATERKYHINELECLSVVTFIKKYKIYLNDSPFIVRTDSRALLWLNKHKDDKTIHQLIIKELIRWNELFRKPKIF